MSHSQEDTTKFALRLRRNVPELREHCLISNLFGVNLFYLSVERSSVVL